MALRLIDIEKALRLQVVLCSFLGFEVPTVSEAIRLLVPVMDSADVIAAKDIAAAANSARHYGLIDGDGMKATMVAARGDCVTPACPLPESASESSDVDAEPALSEDIREARAMDGLVEAVASLVAPSVTVAAVPATAYLLAVQEAIEHEFECKELEVRLAGYQAVEAAFDLATMQWATRKRLCMGIIQTFSEGSGIPVGLLVEKFGVATDEQLGESQVADTCLSSALSS